MKTTTLTPFRTFSNSLHRFFNQKLFLLASTLLVISCFASGYLSAQTLNYYPPAFPPDPVSGCGTDDRITITFNLDPGSFSHFELILLDENSVPLADGDLFLIDSFQVTHVFEVCVPAGGCSKMIMTPYSSGFNGTYTVEWNGTLIASGVSFTILTFVDNIGPAACASLPDCDGYLSLVGEPVPGSDPFCGSQPPRSPCPTLTWRYCAFATNIGQDPIQPGSQVVFQLDEDMTYLGVGNNPCNMNFLSYNSDTKEVTFETTQDIPASNSCEICIDVSVALTATAPWSTEAHFFTQCASGTDDEAAFLQEESQCSCDPNDMQVSPAGCGPQGSIANERLTYHIRFQNLGLGPAHDVVIRDVLDNELDISSLQLIASSHPLTGFAMQPGNELVISFEGIELPAAIFDEAGSNGYIIFSILPQSGIPDGTVIENTADIYFDANDPVTTNTVTNTIFEGFTPPEVDITTDQTTAPEGCAILSAEVYGGVTPYTYSWSSGETTEDITVCPSEPTFFRVTVTDANACVRTSGEVVNSCSEEVYCGNNGNKIQVCHLPPGNPAGRFTLCINPDALESHLEHGDFVGSCDQSGCILPPSIAGLAVPEKGSTRFYTYPNPFSDLVMIEYYLPADEEIHLDVLNINGQIVRRLHSGHQPEGARRLEWDGRDEEGNLLPNGLYLMRLRTNQDINERKVIKVQ